LVAWISRFGRVRCLLCLGLTGPGRLLPLRFLRGIGGGMLVRCPCLGRILVLRGGLGGLGWGLCCRRQMTLLS
jgi:hypothetical protein